MRLSTAAIALLAFVAVTGAAAAQEFIGSYTARISKKDHFASDGYPLDSAAQMVRQDRANWHRFGKGDREDEDDPWFGTAAARTRMEQMLNRADAMSQATRRAIVNGEPVVSVDVYYTAVKVTIIGY